MECPPHTQRAGLSPRLGVQDTLDIHGGSECVRSRSERRIKGIPDSLEDIPAVTCNRLLQQSVMPGEGGLHRIRVLFPEFRTTLDVGEEKGDSARGEYLF
jgi:hypothetical protein